MSKPKTLLRHGKGKQKRSQPAPETADEFLAAGVDFEERGEKWRASGDFKSMRAFMQAIELYDSGLQRFPKSFDLAYNKARIQLEIATHPALAIHIQAPLRTILRTALESHRYALDLDQDNSDVLFNTAQVLTSIAEITLQDPTSSDDDALSLLHEALELFQRCLTGQELKYTESEEQKDQMQAEMSEANFSGEMPLDKNNANSSLPLAEPEEQWASIIEPVTKDTLLDTTVAQLSALTTLCNLLSSSPLHQGTGLPWVEEFSGKLINVKMPVYLDGAHPAGQAEATVARAIFLAALLHALFYTGRIDLPTFKTRLDTAFAPDNVPSLPSDPHGLSAHADALMLFDAAVIERVYEHNSSEQAQTQALNLRWQALSVALLSLTAASRLAEAPNSAKIHIGRGDVEMRRSAMAQDPYTYEPARKNLATLLKNAATYYRGAAALARKNNHPGEEVEASVKEAIAVAIGGGSPTMPIDAIKGLKEEQVIRDMVEDHIIQEQQVLALGIGM